MALLVSLPGLTAPEAERLVAARAAAGGFSSIEEMAVLADLPPHVVDQVRDRLVFSPR